MAGSNAGCDSAFQLSQVLKEKQRLVAQKEKERETAKTRRQGGMQMVQQHLLDLFQRNALAGGDEQSRLLHKWRAVLTTRRMERGTDISNITPKYVPKTPGK